MIENYLEKIKQRLKVVVLHAVIYTRYSSDNQRSESIDAQIRLIRKWAQEYNILLIKFMPMRHKVQSEMIDNNFNK